MLTKDTSNTVRYCNPTYQHFTCFMYTIHTLQLNFLLSDWLFSKYEECIENVHCFPRTAPRLHPDCARGFWCVISHANVTLTDPFFSLGKAVNILHVYWHFKAILFIVFHEHGQIILFFYVMYELG